MAGKDKPARGKMKYGSSLSAHIVTSSPELAESLTNELDGPHVKVQEDLKRMLGEPAAVYIVDTKVKDMDTWPAPLVLDPDAKEKMWLFLVSEPKDMSRLVDTPPDSAFFDRDAKASNGIRSYIEKRLDPEAGRRLEKVDYVDARRTFVVRFDNNKTYALALDDIAGADATEVLSWQVGEGRQYFKVTQLSGNLLEVPWDVVLCHCEPAYEYYKGRERSEESDARAERIGQRIKTLRQEKGMTSTLLAQRSGMKRPNLSRLESGKHVPSLETLERVAEALGVPVVRLVAQGAAT